MHQCLFRLQLIQIDDISAFADVADIKGQGIPILLVEQYGNARKALQFADYAYVLEQSIVVYEGEVVKLQQDPRIISAYLG